MAKTELAVKGYKTVMPKAVIDKSWKGPDNTVTMIGGGSYLSKTDSMASKSAAKIRRQREKM